MPRHKVLADASSRPSQVIDRLPVAAGTPCMECQIAAPDRRQSIATNPPAATRAPTYIFGLKQAL
ncbi:MAG: hypothetical protein IPM54_36655 [Polyangiaceae bacterium]|nr:hypothetical protein [Polyangiaceae bacterium]